MGQILHGVWETLLEANLFLLFFVIKARILVLAECNIYLLPTTSPLSLSLAELARLAGAASSRPWYRRLGRWLSDLHRRG